jgi:hypothetical protein
MLAGAKPSWKRLYPRHRPSGLLGRSVLCHRRDIHTYSMAYGRNGDRKRTAEVRQNRIGTQSRTYSPIFGHSRTLNLAANAGEPRKYWDSAGYFRQRRVLHLYARRSLSLSQRCRKGACRGHVQRGTHLRRLDSPVRLTISPSLARTPDRYETPSDRCRQVASAKRWTAGTAPKPCRPSRRYRSGCGRACRSAG